jgi:hypothetical protein
MVGHPDEARHPLALDELEGPLGSHLYMITSVLPVMNEPSITGTQPVTWKSGHGEDRARRVGGASPSGPAWPRPAAVDLAAPEGHAGRSARHGGWTPPPSGARWCPTCRGSWRRRRGRCRPRGGRRRGRPRPRGGPRRSGARRGTAPDGGQVGVVGEAGGEAVDPLVVGNRTLAPESSRPYTSSSAGPPGVQGHGDGADRADRGEGGDPLGVVAHGDGHPVARADAVAVDQQGAHGVDLGHDVRRRTSARPRTRGRWRPPAPGPCRTGPASTAGCRRRPSWAPRAPPPR